MDLYSIDDERVSSALGYTAHLMCMLAKYLQVPLRYQVIYNASRWVCAGGVAQHEIAARAFLIRSCDGAMVVAGQSITIPPSTSGDFDLRVHVCNSDSA